MKLILNNPKQKIRATLTESGPYLIGRINEPLLNYEHNDIVVRRPPQRFIKGGLDYSWVEPQLLAREHPEISEYHAIINLSTNEVELANIMGRNGLWLNGDQIDKGDSSKLTVFDKTKVRNTMNKIQVVNLHLKSFFLPTL
jgi:pSer/pThr/pTyr-binding forkhead associated (FHA) protein